MSTNPKNTAQAPASTLQEHERQRCEIWTRVMGYHRPVSSFNRGKKGEFQERVSFREPVGTPSHMQDQSDDHNRLQDA